MIKIANEDIGKFLKVTLKKDNKNIVYEGSLVEFSEKYIKLKLIDNGYNIGVLKKNIINLEITDKSVSFGKRNISFVTEDKKLPNIVYIGTGGTIGTHVDYVTGGLNMCRTPAEIISTTPELANIINIKKMESPFIKASEDIYYKDWQKLSEIIYKYLNDDSIDGIIITHGTDILSFTGYALSFMIENINKPILLVGAQRSPDRASFDGSLNLICAANFIKEKIPGVFTVMHASINDDYCNVIKAVKSRKMHTSRRDAFKAINDIPLCKIFYNGKIEYNLEKPIISNKLKPILKNSFEDKVALVKIYPNSDPSIIEWYINKGYKGIILEGTGLGHMPTGIGGTSKDDFSEKGWLSFIEKAINKGIIVIMTSQCLYGRVNGSVYANLRYASKIGVNYLNNHDMLPEVALVKLSVAISKFEKKYDVIKYMQTNIAGEINLKETPEFYYL